MAVDDLGNSRIDFVWGNMPLQPNHGDDDSARWGMSPYPGDAFADFLVSTEASYARAQQGAGISNQLQAVDSHVIGLRHWASYPEYLENTGATLTVDWWTEGQPAYQYPNIIGLSLEEAKRQLIECGVDPLLLVDTQFDNENPYEGIVDGNPIDPVNAPGADNPGVIIWKYLAPDTQIGTHWDGRPWYAAESNGKVLTSTRYPGHWTAIDQFAPNDFSWWHSFVILQTTDPNKNSFNWWDF